MASEVNELQGLNGSILIIDGTFLSSFSTSGLGARAVTCVTDCVFSALAGSDMTTSGIGTRTFPAGFTYFGAISSFTVTGTAIAYFR